MSTELLDSYEKHDDTIDVKEAVIQPRVDDVPVVAHKHTVRGLKPRHAQMMAIAGAIGTGLFVGTGSALKRAGPLGLLLGYILYSGLIWTSYNAMCEMVTWLPVDGSFLHLAGRYVGPSFGFGMAWLYTYNNAVIVAAEATAVAGFVNYWNDSISNGVWCTLFIVSCFLLNVFGVRIYGEGEFWLSSFKVLLVFALFFFTLITMSGGNPTGDAFGFRYWKDPGPWGNYLVDNASGRFAGFFRVFIQAAFAFGGPDLIAIAAGEIQYPRRVIPSVTNRVIYRLIFFFVGGALCIGILVPSNDKFLGTSQKGAGSSPFVIAATRLKIPVLPHIINAALLTSAWSVGLDCCYCATRSLYSLSLSGHAPKLFSKTWRGVPTASVGFVCLIGCLSFMSLSNDAVVAFNWITNISGSGILLVICLLHFMYIRWHAALKAQGIDTSQLPFHKRGQIYQSYFACFAYFILLITNGFYNLVPGHWDTPDFLFAYLAIPGFLVPFLGHKIYRTIRYKESFGPIPAHEIDLFSGKAEIDEEELTYPEAGESRGAKLERYIWG